MNKCIIFIKTCKVDILQFDKLLLSLKKHNKSKIPVWVSVNDSDFSLFQNNYSGKDIKIIKDSDIVKCDVSDSWRYQQIIKSQLYKLNITENYLCVDSDAFFIKDFYIEDFMVDEDTPYTIIHQQKELFSWLSINRKYFKDDPKDYFEKISTTIMEKIGREGICYDYGPSPIVWSCKVWKSFNDNFLAPNHINYQELIVEYPSEFTWYGEWLLKSRAIPLFPKEPLFKVFHYKKQYEDFIKEGHNIETIKDNYLGIIVQSNWMRKQKWYHRKIKF